MLRGVRSELQRLRFHILGDRILSGFPGSGWAVVDRWSGTADPGWSAFLKNAGATVIMLVAIGYVVSTLRFHRAGKARVISGSSPSAGVSDRLLWSIPLAFTWPVAAVFVGSLIARAQRSNAGWSPRYRCGLAGFRVWRSGVGDWSQCVRGRFGCSAGSATKKRAIRPDCLSNSASARVREDLLRERNLASATSRNPEAIINNRLATEVIDFDLSELGNERRCGLLADFSAVYRDRALERDKQLANALNQVSQQRYGHAFCDRG